MAEIYFSKLFDTLLNGVKDIATDTLEQYAQVGLNDGVRLLNELRDQLEVWTAQVAAGQMSLDDFQYMLLSEKELLEMAALKQAGLSLVAADKFKKAVFDLIISTIGTVIP